MGVPTELWREQKALLHCAASRKWEACNIYPEKTSVHSSMDLSTC